MVVFWTIECMSFSQIAKWIWELSKLHLVAIIRLFVWCTFKVLRWLMLISALARNSPAQASNSSFFYTGIHRASFPDNPVLDCNVVFSPLSESIRSDQLYTMAVAIADHKELPGMNLHYFHRNLGWNYLARPKLLDLPSGDELDLLGQQL